MPRKNGNDFKYELISIWLNDMQKAEYENFIRTQSMGVPDLILELNEAGVKVSFSMQQDEETTLVALTIKPKTKTAQGYVYMYRHAFVEKAIRIAHFHMKTVLDFAGNKETTKLDTNW